MGERIFLTVAGEKRLREELKRLKSQDRPNIIEAIAEARAHGDLKENAEYSTAKNQQSFIEGRIAQLELSLSLAEVINPNTLNTNGAVSFGVFITLLDVRSEKKVTYQLVGNLEADIDHGRISFESPLGKSLIGKKKGDEVFFQAPSGEQIYEIIEVFS